MTAMKKFFLLHRVPISVLALFLLGALLVASSYNLLPGWAQGFPPTARVTALPVATMNKPVQLLSTASVESPKSAPIQTEFSGYISEVYVTEGQIVKTDQPLAKLLLSSTPYRNISSSASKRGGISPEGQTNYDTALRDYNRLQKLYEQGAIAKRQVDVAALRLQAATDSMGNSSAPDTTSSSNTAESNAITISAPNPGKITNLAIIPGKGVEAGQQIMFLDVGEVQLVLHLEQKDLYLVHAGTPTSTEIANQTILGQVAGIFPEIGTNNTPSFRAHISIPNNIGGLLKVGMSVPIRINTGKIAAVAAVPKTAVFTDKDGLQYVYLVDKGKALPLQVSTGETLNEFTEITSHIPEQGLVISNSSNIKAGTAITLVQP